MKWVLLLFVMVSSPMTFAADCYWAVSLSCAQEQLNQFNGIDVVVSANIEQGKTTCPDSGIVGLATAYMLQDKKLIGQACRENLAQVLFHNQDSFGIYALLFSANNSKSPATDAQDKAEQSSKRCVDATYTNRCMIVDQFMPISIQSYLTPGK